MEVLKIKSKNKVVEEAIVLAGGLGTRLRSVVQDIPKPMAPVSGKPFLEYLIEHLESQGIKRVILSVGYKWEYIRNYFGNRFREVEILYSVEDFPLGTGGAIKKALEKVAGDEVFICNGDTLFKINLAKMKDCKKDFKIVLALKEVYKSDRYGSVEIDDEGRIRKFAEKIYRERAFINGGIYLIDKDLFDDFNLPEVFSFEKFLEENVERIPMVGVVFDDYFIDIGVPEDYERANLELGKTQQ